MTDLKIPKSKQEPKGQEPQGPPAPPVRQELPPDAEERLRRLVKARADALQKTVFDDRGRVVRAGITDADEAFAAAAEYLPRFLEGDGKADEVRRYLTETPQQEGFMTIDPMLPANWVPSTKPVKSRESQELEYRAQAGREAHPVLAFLRDYAIDPLGNILPAAGQIVADTAVGAYNLTGANVKSPDIRGFAFSTSKKDAATTRDELDAIERTASGFSQFERGAGKMVGMGLGFGAGGPVNLGGKVGGVVGKSLLGLAGRQALGKALGAGAGTFAQYEYLTARDEQGNQGGPLDPNRLAGLGKGVALGGALGTAHAMVSVGLRKMFATAKNALAPDEKAAMDALKKWAQDNGVKRWKGESDHRFDGRVVDTWIEAGLPGAPAMIPKKLAMYAMQGGADGLGFSLLDEEFRRDLMGPLWSGDPEAAKRVFTKLGANTFGGALLHMPLSRVVPWQRRQSVGKPEKPPEPPFKTDTGEMQDQPPAPPHKPNWTWEEVVAARERLEAERLEAMKPREGNWTPEQLQAEQAAAAQAEQARQAQVATPREGNWTPEQLLAEREQAAQVELARQQEVSAPREGNWRMIEGGRQAVDPGTLQLPPPPRPMTHPATGTTMESQAHDLLVRDQLSAKAGLPGTEVSLGTYAVPGNGTQPGVMRKVVGGKVYESPISTEPTWKPIEETRAREADHIGPEQKALAAELRDVVNTRQDLPQEVGDMLGGVLNVVERVSAENDQSVRETIATLPTTIEALRKAPPEMAAELIRELGEFLTIRAPADQPPKEPAPQPPAERRGEAGHGTFLTAAIKGVAETTAKAGRVLRAAWRLSTPDMAKLVKNIGAKQESPEARQATEDFSRVAKDVQAGTRLIEGQARKNLRAADFDKYAESVEGREALSSFENVTTPAGNQREQLRYILGAEGKIPGKNAAEKAVFEGMNKFGLTFSHAFAEAGGFREVPNAQGGVDYVRATKAPRLTVPRLFADEFDQLQRTPKARREFWDDVAKENPDLGKTGEQLEAQWDAAASVTKPGEREAAFEKFREIKYIPPRGKYGGKEWQILEPDAMDAMNALAQSQAPRVAVTRSEFGQDLPKDVRKREGVTKIGISESIEGVLKKIEDPHGELGEIIRRLAAKTQGQEPSPPGMATKFINELMAIPRSIWSFKSGIQDIGALFAEPVINSDLGTMAKALWDTLRHPKLSRDAAEDMGAVAHEMGNLNQGVSDSFPMKFAEIISKPSSFAERWKTIAFTNVAKRVLERMQSGGFRSGDKNLLDQMGFTKGERQKLLDGEASEQLQHKFLVEMTRHMTARGKDAEGSVMSSSPQMKAWVSFTRFASKHFDKLAGEIAQLGKAETIGDKFAATGRVMKRVAGAEFAGLAGTALYYILNDALKGENGWARFLRDFNDHPGSFMLKAAGTQMLAGPYAMLTRAIADDENALWGLTGPGAEVKAFIDGVNAVRRGGTAGEVFSAMERAGEQAGFIPKEARTVATALDALRTGTREAEQRDTLSSQAKRAMGITLPFVERNKPNSYYSTMRELESTVMNHKASDGDLWPKVKPLLDKAMEMAPGESVAAKIRTMQHTYGVPDEQMPRFIKYVGEEQARKMFDDDAALLQLANEVGKMEGGLETPWQEALSSAEQQAKLGGNNVWRDLLDRAVESRLEQIKTHEPSTINIDELAEKMALYPGALERESTLGDEDKRRLRGKDQRAASRILRAIIIERAVDRRMDEAREAAKKRAAVAADSVPK